MQIKIHNVQNAYRWGLQVSLKAIDIVKNNIKHKLNLFLSPQEFYILKQP